MDALTAVCRRPADDVAEIEGIGKHACRWACGKKVGVRGQLCPDCYDRFRRRMHYRYGPGPWPLDRSARFWALRGRAG